MIFFVIKFFKKKLKHCKKDEVRLVDAIFDQNIFPEAKDE